MSSGHFPFGDLNMKAKTVRAAISGHDRCDAEGLTVRAFAPVLAMCRKLVDAGHDPATPLHAYRGDTLAMSVTSIGWDASAPRSFGARAKSD
jgi:hypothetical protein